MAKGNPDTKAKGKAATPFRRFERPVTKIVDVPKPKVHKKPTAES